MAENESQSSEADGSLFFKEITGAIYWLFQWLHNHENLNEHEDCGYLLCSGGSRVMDLIGEMFKWIFSQKNSEVNL